MTFGTASNRHSARMSPSFTMTNSRPTFVNQTLMSPELYKLFTWGGADNPCWTNFGAMRTESRYPSGISAFTPVSIVNEWRWGIWIVVPAKVFIAVLILARINTLFRTGSCIGWYLPSSAIKVNVGSLGRGVVALERALTLGFLINFFWSSLVDDFVLVNVRLLFIDFSFRFCFDGYALFPSSLSSDAG